MAWVELTTVVLGKDKKALLNLDNAFRIEDHGQYRAIAFLVPVGTGTPEVTVRESLSEILTKIKNENLED